MRIADIAREFLGRGGKKLRPRLCQAVYTRCGGTGDLSAICEAVECFHKASLIHDDIQDSDEVRYGRPTTWKEYGVAVAIAAGDWLVARGYTLIAQSGFPAAAQMVQVTVKSHLQLCEGQGDELLAAPSSTLTPQEREQQYVSICQRKTGEAFALAAQLGALAAGADDAKFRRYGLTYGVLFQICDDLTDGEHSVFLENLKKKYENEARLSSAECALGVW